MPVAPRIIKVLIVDDSALMRQTLRRMFDTDPEFQVIGAARDGQDAIEKARELHPDVITLDINMPRLDGLSALQILMEEKICPVIMFSSLTQDAAAATFEAMELGAFDVVGKPGGTVSSDLTSVSRELLSKVRAAANTGVMKRLGRPVRRVATPGKEAGSPAAGGRFEAVAMGISTGGPSTLMEILPLLPADLPVSLFLVQHMPASFVSSFVNRLAGSCPLRILEAQTGMKVEKRCCYVASGGMQLTLFRKTNGDVIIRTPTQPQTLFVPSVSVMMESVLKVYGPATVGVLMTGIGDDGADMMVKIRQAGGYGIAESQESAVVFGMPREAIERGGTDEAVPSWQIAERIVAAVRRSS